MRRRAVLAAIGAGSIAATSGCMSNVTGSSCGPGEVTVEEIRNGGYAGEEVTVAGKLDYTLNAGSDGITAFRLDGQTGTIAVILGEPPDRDLEFGNCLRVEGRVKASDDRPKTDDPVIVNARLLGGPV